MALSRDALFKYFEIEETNDYAVIKKAYIKMARALHPDKHPDEQEKYTELFKVLQSNWSLIDSEDKFKAFLDDAPNVDGFSADSSSSAEMPTRGASAAWDQRGAFDDIGKDALKQYRSGVITVFAPVYFMKRNPKVNESDMPSFLFLDKLQAGGVPQISAEKIASALRAMSRMGIFQVGVTDLEAVNIINLHGHRYGALIVEFEIDVRRILERRSEKDVVPNMLNAYEGDYFWLAQYSLIDVADIRSVRGLRTENRGNLSYEYHNTRRWSDDPANFWNQDEKWFAPRLLATNLTTRGKMAEEIAFEIVSPSSAPSTSNHLFFYNGEMNEAARDAYALQRRQATFEGKFVTLRQWSSSIDDERISTSLLSLSQRLQAVAYGFASVRKIDELERVERVLDVSIALARDPNDSDKLAIFQALERRIRLEKLNIVRQATATFFRVTGGASSSRQDVDVYEGIVRDMAELASSLSSTYKLE